MSEITKTIQAKQTQITQLQSDIEALQLAASVLGGKTTAKATRQPKTKQKIKRKRRKLSAAAKGSAAQPKTKRKRKPWSAAARKAMSKRVKASWAKRRRAGR